jgi:hypothetical protein
MQANIAAGLHNQPTRYSPILANRTSCNPCEFLCHDSQRRLAQQHILAATPLHNCPHCASVGLPKNPRMETNSATPQLPAHTCKLSAASLQVIQKLYWQARAWSSPAHAFRPPSMAQAPRQDT